jgi:hypothetical protein
MKKKLGRFEILYVPRSVGAHYHRYSLKDFLNRQVSVGLAAKTLLQLHPELESEVLGNPSVLRELRRPAASLADESLLPDYAAVIEGIKSFGIILDSTQNLGSQNWHGTYLTALFRLAMDQGVVASCDDAAANIVAAYQAIIQRFLDNVSEALEAEVLGRFTREVGPVWIGSRAWAPRLAHYLRRALKRVPVARSLYHAWSRVLAKGLSRNIRQPR